jgi:transposase
VISQGLPIYVALEPVDMRVGYQRLGGLVRERMQAEPRSKALFVFVGKRGQTMKVLTWHGTGAIVLHKKLDAGKFELPKTTRVDDQHVIVSDAPASCRRPSLRRLMLKLRVRVAAHSYALPRRNSTPPLISNARAMPFRRWLLRLRVLGSVRTPSKPC